MSSSFITLIGFEFKKIFKRKATYYALAMVIIVVLIATISSALGTVTYSDGRRGSLYARLKNEQKAQRALAGDIDEELIREAITQSQIAWSDPANLSETKDISVSESSDGQSVFSEIDTLTAEAYDKYIIPYEAILAMIRQVYAPVGSSYSSEIERTMNPDEAKDFHAKWQAKLDENIAPLDYNKAELAKYDKMKAKISLPLKYDESYTLTIFTQMFAIVSIFAALAISICIAPIFAGEYSTRTDQLILTSKFGKNKVISAKLVAGITFIVMVNIGLMVLTLIILSLLYGFDGANASIQVLDFLSFYPLTILQAALIVCLISTLAISLVGSITMLLSAYFKSSFPVIIIINLLVFVPLIIPQNLPIELLDTIMKLIPTNMVLFYNTFSLKFFNFFGLAVTPPVFHSILCIVIAAITFPLAYRGFKNHQIG